MGECYIFDFNKLETYEIGALLVTILAYPKKGSDEERSALHAALCSLVLYERSINDPKWAASPQLIKPIYAFRDEAQIKKDMRKLERLLRDRAIAGRMAMALLQEVEGNGKRPETLPEEIKKVTLDQLAVMVKDEILGPGIEETENIEKRIWRPSLPVIHIAAAMQVLLQGLDKKVSGLPSMSNIWTSREAIEWLVVKAQYFETLIATKPIKKNGKILIKPEQLIKLRLSEK